MKKTFLFIAALLMVASVNAFAAAGDLLCGGSFVGSFPNSESWVGSDEDYYSGNGYKFDQNETLQSPNLTAGVKKVKIRILVGHNGGATSTLTVGAFDSEGSQLSISENIVPKVAYTAQTDDAIQEFILDGDGVSDIKYVLISFTKVKNYGMKTFEVYDATGTATVTLDSLIIKGKAEKMEYEVGEAFDPAGLEVWGIYTKIEKHDSTSQITSGITWTIDPETFATVSDNESVTLVASYKELTTADTTITGINVTEPAPLSEYAYIYTSNVEYGGSDTVIYDKVKYGAKKMAKNAPATITVPAGTKTLHIHAAAWNKEGNEWTISGLTKDVKITAVADAGVSGNPPFTLQNDPATNDYFAIETNNNAALTLTITLPKDKRGVIFGINAEMQEGVIAAPAFTPATTDFDGSVEVTLTCETEGAEIFYALNEEVTSMNATKYTEPIKLTATTTIYAVAKKEGKESAQANKTYNLVPVYTLAELVAAGAPTADKKKVILVLENEVITGIDGTRGIYVKSGDQEVEVFCYNLPETAVKGAYVSGRAMGDWFLFGTEDPKTWELQPADWSWATFTTTPTALQQVMMQGNIRKAMHNGRMFILKDNKMFDLQGMLVK